MLLEMVGMCWRMEVSKRENNSLERKQEAKHDLANRYLHIRSTGAVAGDQKIRIKVNDRTKLTTMQDFASQPNPLSATDLA